jgi:ABC-type transport system substrate-binding protein
VALRTRLLLPIFATGIAAAIACGGTETVVETVIVKETQVVKEVQTVVVAAGTQTPVATPASTVQKAPQPSGGPSGTIRVARADVGVPVGLPAQCPPSCEVEKWTMGAYEMLLRAVGTDYQLQGSVAESWKLTEDASAYIWTIRKGVKFHKGWGEVTAEDVAWSHNNANSATNKASVHDNAGDLAAHIGQSEVLDPYTVRMQIIAQDGRQPTHLFTPVVPRGAAIHSKKVLDKFGETGMLNVFVGTGPYEIMQWRQDDRLVLKANRAHWRKVPSVENFIVLAVPEAAVRAAMFESGEVQIADVEPKDRARLIKDHGGKLINNGGSLTGIHPAGNYLEKVGARTGKPLVSPGYDPKLPWVADINDPSCDYDQLWVSVPKGPVCKQWESARLVRRALEITIDRDVINEQVYSGVAVPSYGPPAQASISKLFKPEWKEPYDLAKAKQWLAQAGYPNGLNQKVTLHAAPGLDLRLGQILCSGWRELGLTCEFDQRIYAVLRPSYVDRSNKAWGFVGIPRFDPEDWPVDTEDHSWKEGGTQKGGNIPFSAKTFDLMRSEPDKQKRLQYYQDWIEHYQYWAWFLPIADVFNQAVYDARTIEWNRSEYPTFGYAFTLMMPAEDWVLKK